MALEDYRRKRRFSRTPEPKGRVRQTRSRGLTFVVQKHAARRLHYDFRLELDGVLKSWAVPKGPSLDPADKRLAVAVEDHPIEYGGFEGTIPEGEYGGGTVMVWDRGTWQPEGDPAAGLAKGNLKFTLEGKRLKGKWALVRMGGARNADGKNWLLIKERDAVARPGEGAAPLARFERSALSRRTMDGIAKANDRVWHSSKRASATLARTQRLQDRVHRERDAVPASSIAGARRARLPAVPQAELATLVDAAPDGAAWLHEIKYDGYRMLARIERGAVRMFSRNGKDWSRRFPEIDAALAALPVTDAVLDGEIVHLLPDGMSSFSALKDDLSAKRTAHLVYFVFDLLHLDGHALDRSPLLARKEALASLLDGGTGPVRFSGHVVGDGGKFFETACAHGLEGIISKRADAPYRAERTRDWLKVKCVRGDEFVVLGWTDPEGKRKGFGALLLGYHDKKRALHFAGAVGTGFDARTLGSIKTRLDRIARQSPPSAEIAKEAPRGAHWVRPELVAQVQYTEWTEDGRLRHPSFQGLREDKAADEVVMDPPAPRSADAPPASAARPSRAAAATAGVRLTHPDKLLYPADGITKLDLANYYAAVAQHMLPHVSGRPLTLLRCPEGQAGHCFYQKHPGDSAPAELRRIEIAGKDGNGTYLIADDLAGLVALVQMGALEIHVWGSTRRALEKPDRVILDLDPDEGLAWERVVEGAIALRDLLAEMGLQSFAKATGGKGLHVVLPLRPKYGWDEIKAFSHAIAGELVRRHPEYYTGSLPKAARHGKIFIDYLRNQRGATAIAPFSARARPGAPVAAPLSWPEVEKGVRSDAFTVATMQARLARQRRAPWAGLADLTQTLPAAAMRALP